MKALIKITILISTIFLASCEKDIILELADTSGRYLIVEASIIDDSSLQWIRLTQSTSYYEKSTGIPVDSARVTITDGQREFIFMEAYKENNEGFYFNNQIGALLQEGNTYKLHISTREGEVFFAESTYKPVPTLDSVTFKLNPFSELGINPKLNYDIVAHFEDLPTSDNYYLFNLFINGKLKTVRPADKAPMSDINLETNVSYAVLTVSEDEVSYGDTLSLEIRSISRENFDFHNVFFFQTDLSGNPFAGAPPANIPTNLSQGARGFFQISAADKKSVIFRENPD